MLPDVVGDDPVVVFCGEAGAESTKSRDHRYETPGNAFYELLHASGMTPERLRPDEEHRLPAYGLGTTDLVGHWDPRWVEVDALVAKVERWRPEWLAFVGKGTAQTAARALGRRRPRLLGPTDWYLGGAQVFVLPGPSGAHRRHDYDGRPHRLAWWHDLAGMAGLGAAEGPGQSEGPGGPQGLSAT